MTVAFRLSKDRKMKNCIFEMHKFIFWFISKKNIKIYKRISLEL